MNTQNQTAQDEQGVNFHQNYPLVLELQQVLWYNRNTETGDNPRLLVRRSELPASDAARGFAEISTDDCAMSDPQWRKSGSVNCRKVVRLHTKQREDVLFVTLRLCGLPDFYYGGCATKRARSTAQIGSAGATTTIPWN